MCIWMVTLIKFGTTTFLMKRILLELLKNPNQYDIHFQTWQFLHQASCWTLPLLLVPCWWLLEELIVLLCQWMSILPLCLVDTSHFQAFDLWEQYSIKNIKMFFHPDLLQLHAEVFYLWNFLLLASKNICSSQVRIVFQSFQ